MSTITVTKVGVLSIGKLTGTVNLIIGLATGIIAGIAGTIAYFSTGSHGTNLEGALGGLAILLSGVVLYPLIAFAFGWLYGVLAAFIFNVVVGVSGGVELTIQDNKGQASKAKD